MPRCLDLRDRDMTQPEKRASKVDPNEREEMRRRWHRWKRDPVAFANEALAIEVWRGPSKDRPGQAEILEAVRDHRQVAVRSGTKLGKTVALAILAWWWFTFNDKAQIYLTAPSEETVRDALWKELRLVATGWQDRRDAWARRFGTAAALAPIVDPAWMALDPRAGVRSPNGEKHIVVRTTSPNKVQRMAGKSGHQSLWIVDEASDYDKNLIEALIGNLSGGGHVVLTSQGHRQDGVFYDCFNDQAEFWKGLHIRTTDSPNVREGRMVIEGMVLRDIVEQYKREWGEDSERYRVRILGEFPKQALDTVFARSALEQSIARTRARAALGGG